MLKWCYVHFGKPEAQCLIALKPGVKSMKGRQDPTGAATPTALGKLKARDKRHVCSILSISNQRDPRGSVETDMLSLALCSPDMVRKTQLYNYWRRTIREGFQWPLSAAVFLCALTGFNQFSSLQLSSWQNYSFPLCHIDGLEKRGW